MATKAHKLTLSIVLASHRIKTSRSLNECLLSNSLNYMIYAFKCINLIPYILIWATFDCRHKLDQIEVRYHKLEGAKEKKRGAN